MLDIANFFSSVKISPAALKLIYLGTYRIFFGALSYGRSVNINNQDSKRTGTISSAVLKLSSSYIYPSLLAEFIRIG